MPDPVLDECPPCKIIICGSSAAGLARNVAALAESATQLALLRPKADARALVSVLDGIEDEMRECGDKLLAALNTFALQK